MKSIKCICTTDFEKRLTKGKIYKGTLDHNDTFHFKCNLGAKSCYNLNNFLHNPRWLILYKLELNKNIQIL